MYRISLVLACLVAAVSLPAGCAPQAPAPKADGRLGVVVSILPEAFFVERIGGDHVAVTVLVGPGQSPHTYEPTPRQMVEVSQAQLFMAIGWPFEKQLLEKLSSLAPQMKVVDLREGVKLRYLTTAEQQAEAADEPAGAAEPAGEPDPHIWLSPHNARLIAATVARALCDADPDHIDEYRRNYEALQNELAQLDFQIAQALHPLKGRDVFVYHPAFGYFLEQYGLQQVPVELEGKEPTARQLTELIAKAKAERVRVIFVQPQFSAKSAETVAASIGGAVVPIDDLAKDYITNLTDMAEKVRKAIAD